MYPQLAVSARLEGRVLLSVLIAENGSVIKTNIVTSTSHIFNNAAIDAVMKTKFQPGIMNGTKIKSWIQIPIVFRLR